jgi:hypothetical protein
MSLEPRFLSLTPDHEAYRNERPFPHVVIDWAMGAGLSDVMRDLRGMSEAIWSHNLDYTAKEQPTQVKKTALADPRLLPPSVQEVFEVFSSQRCLDWLTRLTGIRGLYADPVFLGGGVHRISKGGKLSIHADFNLHPKTGKHRRINALLHLNENWKVSDEGCLELWDKQMQGCVQRIGPLFDRLVIFNITDDALHGHPVPWNCDEPRLSFAFYYYTDDRPDDEKAPFHWADWKCRPGQGW